MGVGGLWLVWCVVGGLSSYGMGWGVGGSRGWTSASGCLGWRSRRGRCFALVPVWWPRARDNRGVPGL
ncbi:MAG: hypothetical protein AN487_18265 [Anabaena sp. CRKS33]|nr:MAG: hypothetical protein AN487_18265 [Anabaena sp. CRKS33]